MRGMPSKGVIRPRVRGSARGRGETRGDRTTDHSQGDDQAYTGHARSPAAGDGASSTLLSFLVAAGIFTLTMAFTFQYISTAGTPGPDLERELGSKATQALEITVEEAGFTTDGSSAWHENPDDLQRFGLATTDDQNVLDWEKLQKLRDGKLQADDSNGEPDYPEVRAALGLEATTDFHLRTRPLFLPMESSDWGPDPNIEVAYIAHGDKGSSNPGRISSTSTTATGDAAVWEVTVENTGDEPMVYKVTFEVETDADGEILVDDEYTRMMDPSATDTVEISAHEVDEWDGDTAHVNATVYDAWSTEHDTHDFSEVSLPADDDGSTDVEHNLKVTSGTYSFDSKNPTLYLDHYDHAGDRINDQGSGPEANLSVVNPSGTEIVNTTVTLENNKALEWTCDACEETGNYTATLMTPSHTRVAVDRFHNASTERFPEDKTPTGDAEYEMGLIGDVVEGFDNTTHEGEDHGDGDVYVDEQSVLSDHLTEHLSDYDVLVVGTNVGHNAMTSGNVKWPVHDWVNEEGGHLVVLGNDAPNTQWLEPLYGSGSTTASGGVSTPDPTHPVLHNPEELDYEAYDDHDTAWKLRSGADDYYTHVLQKESSGSHTEDTLAVSEPGAFGDGSVVLASYNLSDLTDPQKDEESKKFLRNMVLESYHMVFVDYGPEIPENVVVASKKRLAMVPHPTLPAEEVEVKVLLYVWK